MIIPSLIIRSSFVSNPTFSFIPLISSLLEELDIDPNASILTSHLRAILTLHSALFLPCSSIINMTLAVPKKPYNAEIPPIFGFDW